MIDKTEMRSHLESMERAASEVLQRDAAFFEALQALRWEIERDPRVQTVVKSLRGAGGRVFTSFVPRVKVRIRTKDGVFALPWTNENRTDQGTALVRKLTQDLKNAARAVILSSRIRHQLDKIVNEAVSTNDDFESIAAEIERRGHEVSICLDLSAYAQVHEAPSTIPPYEQSSPRDDSEQAPRMTLSSYDLSFMKSLKIRFD